MYSKKGSKKCINCGHLYSYDCVRIVDGKPICVKCLYGDVKPVDIWPIGIVVNNKRRLRFNFGTTGSNVSEIHLYSGMARFMNGLMDETHLTIVWHLHNARGLRTLFPRGWDRKKVGPFASRTPDRLTPIAVTDVELLEVNGTKLIVRGLDAINGTLVLDIKVSKESLKGS